MALRKSCVNFLQIKHYIACERKFSVTSSLLWFKRFTRVASFKEKEKRYKEKDKVPQNFELIYTAPMQSYVAWATHVSTASASIISIVALYQFAVQQPIWDPVETKLIMHSEDVYYFAAGFLAINAVLRLVVSIYPLRIYKSQKNYIAVYHSQLPLLTSHHHFERGQIKEVNYLFSPWNNITFKLGNKTSLLLDDYFKTPSEFHEMLNDAKQ